MSLVDTMLSVLFPPVCAACGRGGAELCLGCLRAIPAAERESAAWIFPACDYRDPALKRALWLFKYKGRKRLAAPFAEVVYEKILEELSDLGPMENFASPILIPVPLSAQRRRKRGYNQAELLCRGLADLDILRSGPGLTLLTDVLLKPRETEHQARIKNRAERMKNIRGTFVATNAERIRNRNVILVDDIVTTGATLTEARNTLRQAGARKVIAFTVAH